MTTVVDAPPTTVHVLYGSETGNAEFLCDDVVEALGEHGIHAASTPLDDIPADQLGTLGTALIVVSTTGDGEMPYGADAFWERIDTDRAPRCDGLRYAVLALGDSTYTYFCEAGTLIDERLAELGATRIADRVDCDAAYDARAEAWIKERVAQLLTLVGVDDAAVADDEAPVDTGQAAVTASSDGWDPKDWGPDVLGDDRAPSPTLFGSPSPEPARASAGIAAPSVRSPWTREQPFPATLTARRRMSGPGHDVVHCELDLTGSDIVLQPGDSLGVVAVNDDDTVRRFLDAAGADGTACVDGQTLQILAHDTWELRFPSAALLEAVGRDAPHTAIGAAAVAGDRAGMDDWVRTHTVADALTLLPRALASDELATLMRPIRARAYSVASSPLVHPGSAHLLVAVERPNGAFMRSGTASGFLADRVSAGDHVKVFPMPNRSFHLPDDPSTPIIMIGPGVGVAPFRAFVQHRSRQPGAGPVWLFFGGRHKDADFLYRDEWQTLRDEGVLTRIDTAFSRDQADKIYVQHRMREHAAELADWVRRGACVYVCGDARHMAVDVDTTLRDILRGHREADAEDALFSRLCDDKRYRVDVY